MGSLNSFIARLNDSTKQKMETVRKNYAISLQTVKSQTFNGITFVGVEEKSPELPLKKIAISTVFNDSVPDNFSSSISIPRIIFNESNITINSRKEKMIFIFYKETKFFQMSLLDTKKASSRLNSYVISGSIDKLSFENLSTPVKIAFHSITRGDAKTALCSYWDLSIAKWSQEGCTFEKLLNDGRILCTCKHLTNFAMLMVYFFRSNTSLYILYLSVGQAGLFNS